MTMGVGGVVNTTDTVQRETPGVQTESPSRVRDKQTSDQVMDADKSVLVYTLFYYINGPTGLIVFEI